MASLKKAIADKCKDCTYDHQGIGTWREQVENCTVSRCPLWQVRPVSGATIALRRRATNVEVNIDALIEGLEDEEEVA